jgi:hypothetical protein
MIGQQSGDLCASAWGGPPSRSPALINNATGALESTPVPFAPVLPKPRNHGPLSKEDVDSSLDCATDLDHGTARIASRKDGTGTVNEGDVPDRVRHRICAFEPSQGDLAENLERYQQANTNIL